MRTRAWDDVILGAACVLSLAVVVATGIGGCSQAPKAFPDSRGDEVVDAIRRVTMKGRTGLYLKNARNGYAEETIDQDAIRDFLSRH